METKIENEWKDDDESVVLNQLGLIALLAVWVALVLAWRNFVGSDDGVMWLVHRLFG